MPGAPQSVLIRLYDPQRDEEGLRDCVVEQQEFHRSIESAWRQGRTIVDEYLDYLRRQCYEHDGAIFVAAAEEQAVGFVCVVASVPGTGPDDPAVHAWVHDVFVRPEWR